MEYKHGIQTWEFCLECAAVNRKDSAIDVINHPPHYNSGKAHCGCGRHIECIDITRHMNFNIGNAIKYLWRFEHKAGIEDLKKAIWYINDEINKREIHGDK